MSGVNGLETIIYGVEDLALSSRFFVDFGLHLIEQSDSETVFELADGSTVILRPYDATVVSGQKLKGFGVQQMIWGVPSQKLLDRLVANLRTVTEVTIDADGTARYFDCDGIASGLRVFNKQMVWGAPDPVNSFSNINRLNTNRKWRVQAKPKAIQHIVYQVPNPQASWEWYKEYLDFRLSDIQQGFGVFARAPGTISHHTIYWLNANLPFPGNDGNVRFNHVNYEVEDIDEVMVGANYMERKGWNKSIWGLGRHRIASSIFLYLPCPAGGEAEYGTDSDALDDSWIPRTWNASFGTMSFMHNLQPWLIDAAPWDVGYAEGAVPTKPEIVEATSGDAAGAIPARAHPEGSAARRETTE